MERPRRPFLLGHLLETAGVRVGVGGNVGGGLAPAASELALMEPAPDWYVLEMSSFQLSAIQSFRPDVGVLTNLSPDHLGPVFIPRGVLRG
ncbi:MAG: hypothetical protein Ct9H300mP15_22550 [Gemmatimonadota bacterium]|nr:MAG: hypothetical protein Ct9H300mP15_22550 [Gemmatimonadota bacterium]